MERNPETRKPPGNDQKDSPESTPMLETIRSMERLSRFAEDHPEQFRKLVNGEECDVKDQLVDDLETVRDVMYAHP